MNYKLPPLPETGYMMGGKGYSGSQMQAYAIAAIEAQGVPDGLVLVDRGVLHMVVNALRRDAEDGRKVRGEMADMLASAPPAPQTKPWPLSDEQIELLMRSIGTTYADDNDERMRNHAEWQRMNHRQIVRAIEDAHGITKE